MNKKTSCDTALLIFAKSAKVESKSLVGDSGINTRILSLLQQKVENTSEKSGLPYFIIDENKQIGDSFGERLSNAFEQVYGLDFKHVIVIGNDCPTLKAEDLLLAKTIVESGKTVIGPDKRGGVYLLGISKIHFDANLLTNVQWQDKSTFDGLTGLFSTTQIIKVRSDLNHKRDFQVLLRVCSHKSFLRELHKLVSQKDFFAKPYTSSYTQSLVYSQTVLRGPPAL